MDNNEVNENNETNETNETSPNEINPNEKLEAMTQLNSLYLEKIKQMAAEFENYRNRTKKEIAQTSDRAVRDVVLSLLPIIDNFALALKGADKSDAFAAGMIMIQGQLNNMLKDLNIEKIPTIGEKFDTKFHAAVSHINDDSLEENTIQQELLAGYIYKDVVIRHATVVVAN